MGTVFYKVHEKATLRGETSLPVFNSLKRKRAPCSAQEKKHSRKFLTVPALEFLSVISGLLTLYLKVPKREIFDRSDFPDF
jgi:hypothetical protein